MRTIRADWWRPKRWRRWRGGKFGAVSRQKKGSVRVMLNGVDAASEDLMKFTALRCVTFQTEVRLLGACLVAIMYLHKMFGGGEFLLHTR